MDTVLITSFIYNIINATIAVFIAVGALRLLDWMTGLDFHQWMQNATSMSMAIYLGCRLLAVAVFLGQLFS